MCIRDRNNSHCGYQIYYGQYSPKIFGKCQKRHIFVKFWIFLSGKLFGLTRLTFLWMNLDSTQNLQHFDIYIYLWWISAALKRFSQHSATDTLKFWTEKWAINENFFCFSSDFDETWWRCSYPCVLQVHQVFSKSDSKQKCFINSPFFCSEFQTVSRIVKIVHSATVLHISVLYYTYFLPQLFYKKIATVRRRKKKFWFHIFLWF